MLYGSYKWLLKGNVFLQREQQGDFFLKRRKRIKAINLFKGSKSHKAIYPLKGSKRLSMTEKNQKVMQTRFLYQIFRNLKILSTNAKKSAIIYMHIKTVNQKTEIIDFEQKA